ncbi:protein rep, partial [Escherichia coli]|uniref:protein rep n=2 Tax=Bacteria TaxID=2 RepID=UPI001FA77DC8|nr:protein rep [Escherichia coli]
SQDVFDVFYLALKGRQLITFNGLFKEYALKYKNGELDKHKTKDKNEYFYKLIATWNPDLLKFNREYLELSDVEKEKYNGHLVDGMEIE